jgi:hypothetical protein
MIQFLIFVLSALSIWFVTREETWQKWGYPIGLLAQPFWAYASITEKQWGMLALTLFYTYSWSQGVYNHFLKPYYAKKKQSIVQL